MKLCSLLLLLYLFAAIASAVAALENSTSSSFDSHDGTNLALCPLPSSYKHPYETLSFQDLSNFSRPPRSLLSLAKGLVHENGSLVQPLAGPVGFDTRLEYVDTQILDYMLQLAYTYPSVKSVVLDSKAVVPVTFCMAMLALHYVTYQGLSDVSEKSLFAGMISLNPSVTVPEPQNEKRSESAPHRASISTAGRSMYVHVPLSIARASAITFGSIVFQHFYTLVYFSYFSGHDCVLEVYKTATSLLLSFESIVCFLFATRVATSIYELRNPRSLCSGLAYALAFYLVRRFLRNAGKLFGHIMAPILFLLIIGIYTYNPNAVATTLSEWALELSVAFCSTSQPVLSEGTQLQATIHKAQQSEHIGLKDRSYNGFCSLVFPKLRSVFKGIMVVLGALMLNDMIRSSGKSIMDLIVFSLSTTYATLKSLCALLVYRVFSFLSLDFWFTTGFTLIGWDSFLFSSVTRESSFPMLSGALAAARNETFLMVLASAELVFNSTDVCLNKSLHPFVGSAAPTAFFTSALNQASFDLKLADTFYYLIHSNYYIDAVFHSGALIPVLYLGVMIYKFAVGFYAKQEAKESLLEKIGLLSAHQALLAFEVGMPLITLAAVYLAQHVVMQACAYYYDPSVIDAATMARALYGRLSPLDSIGASALSGSLAVFAYQAFRPRSYSFYFSVFYNLGFFYLRAILKAFFLGLRKVDGYADLIAALSILSTFLAIFNRRAQADSKDTVYHGRLSFSLDIFLTAGIAALFYIWSPMSVVKSVFSTLRYEFKYNVGYELGNFGDMFSSIDQWLSEFPLFANIFESTPALASELARLATEVCSS